MKKHEWDSLTPEEKKDAFMWIMLWFHQEKPMVNPSAAISSLAGKIEVASASSEKLTKSIKNATWAASIIAFLALAFSVIRLFL